MNPLMQAISQTNGFQLPCNGDSIFPVLNMLNMKYAIVPSKTDSRYRWKILMRWATLWFINDLKVVDNANDEIAALGQINLRNMAVVDKSFADKLNVDIPDIAPLMAYDEDKIELTHYAPNRIDYRAQNEQNKIAVFSEIYYPHGWHIYLLNREERTMELPLARVNYMLRGAVIPAGTHNIAMIFDPDSVHKGNMLSLICFALFAFSFCTA